MAGGGWSGGAVYIGVFRPLFSSYYQSTFHSSVTSHSVNFTYQNVMQSLCDEEHLLTFAYRDGAGKQRTAQVSSSGETAQLHKVLLTAISEQKPDTEIDAMRKEWSISASRDAKEWVSRLTGNSQSGTSAANTAVSPANAAVSLTDTKSARIPPTAGSQNPSMFGPDKASSKSQEGKNVRILPFISIARPRHNPITPMFPLCPCPSPSPAAQVHPDSTSPPSSSFISCIYE